MRYTIVDATYRLVEGRFTPPPLTWLRFTRRLELFLRRVFFFLPERLREEVVRPKRWKKRLQKLLGMRTS